MNVFYFKINLNKFGELRLQQEKESKTFRNAVIVFVLGAILVMAGWYVVSNQMDEKIENRKSYLAETQNELQRYETSGDYLSSNDLDRLAQTFNNRIFWAKKMVALGQEIDDKLAVRKFSYANGVLTINGITEIDPNVREIDLINTFINRLKSNPEIANDFPDIKSGQILKQIVKDTAIFEFVIECYSRDSQRGAR
ncbi:MAG TPA: hypothetical protein PL188_10045 [Candidatus Cloacimonadota bacterium]|jgi:Tfp pilus assembly protein PilN|nr:hypothetical protein [Candidatus Cloacimonadota bacterium]